MFSRLVFLSLFVAVVAAVLLTNGDLSVLVDVPGLLLVCLLTMFGLLASFGPALTIEAIAAAIRRDFPQRQRSVHVAFWKRGYVLAWTSGVVAIVCGVFLLLSNVDDPSRLGPAFGLCLLPLFWAALLAEGVFGVLAHRLERAAE